jgi:hypothetical protein
LPGWVLQELARSPSETARRIRDPNRGRGLTVREAQALGFTFEWLYRMSKAERVFRLPNIQKSADSATLAAWLVKPGDRVKHRQAVLSVRIGEAEVRVPVFFTGTVTALHAQAGDRACGRMALFSYKADGIMELNGEVLDTWYDYELTPSGRLVRHPVFSAEQLERARRPHGQS